jgi:hypothetical protein
MTIHLGNLPPEISSTSRAVLWNPEQRNGTATKVPYQVRHPRVPAAVNDPRTWAPFAEAYAAYLNKQAFGIGIVFDGSDHLVGIDLDHCRAAGTGVLAPWARAIVERFRSYTEASPSGTGLHIFVRGTLPPHGRKHGPIEVYDRGKYFTVTGDWIEGTPRTIAERTDVLCEWHREVFPPAADPVPDAAPDSTLTDAAVLAAAMRARNGDRFSRLWAGDTSGYDGDDSAADLALCNLLAFWTGRDAGQMDRLFRSSGLMREKWDRRLGTSTYGAATIAKAIVDCRDTYQPAPEITLIVDEPAAEPVRRPGDRPAGWPILADDAYRGTLGSVVDALAPYTEADRVALLTHLLVGFGSLIGRSPYITVGATAHHLNENLLIVGETGTGRKGTAWDEVLALLVDVDTDWAGTRIVGGLSSGEGLISEVRDASPDGEDPGVDDKRLLVIETEFAKVLRVCRREGNTLSTVLRQAWDSGALRTLTRGHPLRATGTHVAIIGHITPRELRQELKRVDMGNGFANRFLTVLVRRSQLLPDGGRLGDKDRATLAQRLEQAASAARRHTEFVRTAAAREHWHSIYADLTGDRDGLVGALANRATAHVIRLSLLYALADQAPAIDLEHQQAAYALWRYSEASIRYLFAHRVGDTLADYLLALIEGADDAGVTQTEIQQALGRHRKADEIHEALQTLVDYGVVESRPERGTGRGRPRTRWYVSEHAKKAK